MSALAAELDGLAFLFAVLTATFPVGAASFDLAFAGGMRTFLCHGHLLFGSLYASFRAAATVFRTAPSWFPEQSASV